jgi:hypothetical protein
MVYDVTATAVWSGPQRERDAKTGPNSLHTSEFITIQQHNFFKKISIK